MDDEHLCTALAGVGDPCGQPITWPSGFVGVGPARHVDRALDYDNGGTHQAEPRRDA